jgi:hypothetical protein
VLTGDDLLAAALEHVDRAQRQAVHQRHHDPQFVRQHTGIACELVAQAGEQRLLEREDECRRFGGREAVHRPRARDPCEEILHGAPLLAVQVFQVTRGDGVPQEREELARLPAQLLLANQIRPPAGQ